MKEIVKFTRDDCWIFLSIPNTKEGGLLYEIVGMSDALDHAIPSESEMRIGLSKGIQAGFVEKKGNRFHYTSKFKQLHFEVFNSKGGLFTKIETLFKLLNKSPYLKVNDFEVKFESKEYEKACWEYSEFFWNRAAANSKGKK
ncbi:MAG: hypothetical protein HRT61_11475 [Ekhidna sp.]|nr:hypothetical protein [Ekhidna sp.]